MMRNKTIYFTKDDARQLRELLNVERVLNHFEQNNLQALETALETALNQGTLIDSGDVSRHVITMNSIVHLLDLDTGEEMICTLVYPDDADIDQNKISVLAPVGTAMLGHSAGDTIEWDVPAGLRRLKVKEILS
jgi:regulator of nucleoside diphosphate kinase